VNIATYLHDPSIPEDGQPPVDAAVFVVRFAATLKRGAFVVQVAQPLPILAVDDAGAPGGKATYQRGERGQGQGGQCTEKRGWR
jgi:hypothetical protein